MPPPMPHIELAVPGWQVPPGSQHPEVQVSRPQGRARPPPTGMPPPVPDEPPPVPALPPPVPLTHDPDMHMSVPVQVVQVLPPEPHFIADGVCTHMVPSQQPPQLAGPHVVAVTQAPAKQLWPMPHVWHTPASVPHARFELPGEQMPPSSRQPGQAKVMHWPIVLQALFCA